MGGNLTGCRLCGCSDDRPCLLIFSLRDWEAVDIGSAPMVSDDSYVLAPCWWLDHDVCSGCSLLGVRKDRSMLLPRHIFRFPPASSKE